jgi:hypothetical protein
MRFRFSNCTISACFFKKMILIKIFILFLHYDENFNGLFGKYLSLALSGRGDAQ